MRRSRMPAHTVEPKVGRSIGVEQFKSASGKYGVGERRPRGEIQRRVEREAIAGVADKTDARTEARLTPSNLASSRSAGRRLPGGNSPLSIKARS